jgi:heptosyltransferase-1
MRVLLIKTSSMGDVLHALPALTDAMHAIPGVRFDWVVEEAFQEIPSWHPAVDRVIPVALRRWRKYPLQALWSGEWNAFKRALKNRSYDVVLDSQGLVKSAWIARKARGLRIGYDSTSARESYASYFYQRKIPVDRDLHAIVRQRQIFAKALWYDVPYTAPNSSLSIQWKPEKDLPYVVLLHSTSWSSKEWPEMYWKELAVLAVDDGYVGKLLWGSEVERSRAERIAKSSGATVLPHLTLGEIASVFSGASGVIGVDSGLAHLSAALGVPAITLYGATDAAKTGAVGRHQENMQGRASCAPCMQRVCEYKGGDLEQQCWREVTPQRVWENLRGMFDA